MEVVAGPLLRNNRQTTDSSSLEGHYVGVYFSAHWVSTERRDKVFFNVFTSLVSSLCVSVRRKDIVSRAEQEDTERLGETDKGEEQEGGGNSIVFVCLH